MLPMHYLKTTTFGFLLILLSGCSTLEGVKDVASQRETVALCKAADVGLTIAALNTGTFHELNPVMNALMGGAHGFMPFVIVSAAYVGIVWWLDKPTVNMVSSAITCPVAARNGMLLLKQ